MFSSRYFGIILTAAVLIGSLVLTVFAGYVLSTVAGLSAETPPVEAAPIPHLSDNLRGDLNAAFTPEFPFDFDTASNPFADKSGVSLTVGNAGDTAPSDSSLPANFNRPPLSAGSYPSHSNVIPPVYPGANVPPSAVIPNGTLNNGFAAPPVNTADLVKERQHSIKLGKTVPPLASLYGIDELRPYGVVGSGNENRVKLFAPSTNDRFSVARGTRFRDGTIVSFGDESVSYRRDSGELVVKRWIKNLRTATGVNQPDAPLLRIDQP